MAPASSRLLSAVHLHGVALCDTALDAFLAVIGPPALGSLSFPGANVRSSAPRTTVQIVGFGDYKHDLERDGGKQQSVILNL